MAERPLSGNHVLHFDALRLAALREGGRPEEAPATENEREGLTRAPAHVHSAQMQLFAAGAKPAAHSQPALRTGLMAHAWRRALCIWGFILGFDFDASGEGRCCVSIGF